MARKLELISVILFITLVCLFSNSYAQGYVLKDSTEVNNTLGISMRGRQFSNDMNGDGMEEFIIRDHNSNTINVYSYIQGARTLIWTYNCSGSDTFTVLYGFYDFDGDDLNEALIYNEWGEYNEASLKLVNWQTNEVEFNINPETRIQGAYWNDYDGDGIIDLLTFIGGNESSLQIMIWGIPYATPSGTMPIATQQQTLSQNYPNPFNPTTNIKYTVRQGGLVEIKIFNVKGELIRTLESEYKQPGSYTVTWDGKNNRDSKLSSGVYFYTLRSGDETSSKKMVLLK